MGNIVASSNGFYKIGTLKESITNSVKRILLTSPGEVLGDPFFGSRLKEFIFDLDFNLPDLISDEIARAISIYEPRVNIKDINVYYNKEEKNKLYINLLLSIIPTFEELQVNFGMPTQE